MIVTMLGVTWKIRSWKTGKVPFRPLFVYKSQRFRSTGGRERGFRGYSWVLDPKPGEWRFTVATGDGRTIGILQVQVRRGAPQLESLLEREF